MKSRLSNLLLRIGICAATALAAAAFAGCAENPLMDSGPDPSVADCAIVSISSPSRYACNGKVYTSFDLADTRTGNPKRPKPN